MESIGAGVVANMLTGFFGLMVGLLVPALWRKFGRPLTEEFLAPGADIGGVWHTKIDFPDGEYNEHRMTLRHLGRKIDGDILCLDGYSKGRRYTFVGTIRDSIVTMTYQTEDGKRLERGSITLIVKRDAKSLDGHVIYYEDQTGNTNVAHCRWERE